MIRSFVTTARRVRSRALSESDESGFTVVEVVVSIALVTIVMTSLAAFFVTSAGVIDNQSQRQTASQLATDAIGTARAQSAGGVVTQRGKGASQTAWNRALADGSPYPGVAAYLTNVQMAYDVSAPANSGADAPLSTNGNQVTIDNTRYTQNWFLGDCYAATTNGACASSSSASNPTHYVQVVVDVTWTGTRCSPTCSYVSATRLSTSPDPLFDAGKSASKPKITNPGNQTSDAGSPVTLALSSSGGTAPLTWTQLGLPDGLSLDTSTSPVTIIGTPSAKAIGTANVTLTLTDAFGFTSTAAFTWKVNAQLTLTGPGNQTSSVGDKVSTAAVNTSGGTGSPTFAASGLPAGLKIDASTGVISGSPTTTTPAGKPAQVTMTATDGANGTASVTFTWTVTDNPLHITNPTSNRSDTVNSSVSLTARVTGGTGPYTWAASGLPQGLNLGSSSGTISGTPTSGYRYVTKLTVKDAKGTATSTTFIWTVAGDLMVTGVGTQSTQVNEAVTFAALSPSGGKTGRDNIFNGYHIYHYYDYYYRYGADGLPAGTSIDPQTGKISGTPTEPGTYVVTINTNNVYDEHLDNYFKNFITYDNPYKSAVAMFVWTVTA